MRSPTLSLFALFTLTACQTEGLPPPAPLSAPRMIGLTAGSALTFGMTDDGGVQSTLYNKTALSYGNTTPLPKGGASVATDGYTMLASQAGVPVSVTVGGFAMTPGATDASLAVSLNGTATDLTAQLGGGKGNFRACFDTELPAPSTRIEWKARLVHVLGQSGSVTVDTIDISVRKAGDPPSVPGECP